MDSTNNTTTTINQSTAKAGTVLCCAGEHCLSNTKVITDVGKHKCTVCKKDMHGNICSDQKSEDLAIMTCLACAAKEKTNNPSAEATGGGGDGGGGDDGSTSKEQDTTEGTSGDDEVIVLEAEGATGLQKVINNSTLDHIIVDQTECNPTDGRKKDPIKTKLRSISAIPVAKLTRPLLISFCNLVNIKQHRNKSKYDLCVKVVEARVAYENNGGTGGVLNLKPSSKDTKPSSVGVNGFRLLNVIFHTNNIPLLDERATCMSKPQLDDGMKTGQTYYTTLAAEYNKKDMEDYDVNLYPDQVTCNPSTYDDINADQAKKWYGDMFKVYERCKANHYVSGTHTEFVDGVDKVIIDEPFGEKYGVKGRVLYTHLLLQDQPGVLATAAALLDEDTFFESCDNGEAPTLKRKKKPLKKGNKTGSPEKRTKSDADEWVADQSLRTRNMSIGIFEEMISRIRKDIRTIRASRDEKYDKLVARSGGEEKRKVVRKEVRDYYEKLDKGEDFGYESENSLIQGMYDLDEEIKDDQGRLKSVYAELKAVKAMDPKNTVN